MALQLNTKCLAYHGPLLYEAKVVKVREPGATYAQTKDGDELVDDTDIPNEIKGEKLYYIHYKGWKSSWDEWVDIRRLRELNVENFRLQKELKSAALNATSSVSITGKRTIDVSRSTTSRANKKRAELEMESEEDYMRKPEINLLIPDSLKSLLVDDWEMVTKEHHLITIPAKPNVNEILRRYRNFAIMKAKNSTDSEIEDEFLSGMKIYFNRCIGSILLYRFERKQYLDLNKDLNLKNRDPSLIYGAEHLLRLLVSLPGLVAQTTMEQQSVAVLKDHLENFLLYLDEHKKELFLKRYESVSPSYESLAKNV